MKIDDIKLDSLVEPEEFNSLVTEVIDIRDNTTNVVLPIIKLMYGEIEVPSKIAEMTTLNLRIDNYDPTISYVLTGVNGIIAEIALPYFNFTPNTVSVNDVVAKVEISQSKINTIGNALVKEITIINLDGIEDDVVINDDYEANENENNSFAH